MAPLLVGSVALLALVVATAYLLGAKAARGVREFDHENHVSFTHRREP